MTLPVQETSDAGQTNVIIILHPKGDDQTPFSKEESSHISLDKMQDDKQKMNVSIMDETMSQTLSCKPQEEDDRPRASKTEEEENALYIADDTVIETQYHTAISQGSEDNSVHFALDDNDAEGGRPDKNANASSKDNNVSSEDTEPDRDNNVSSEDTEPDRDNVSSKDTELDSDNISAEATEPDSDNNYGPRKGVSSCQMLENQKNTFMDGNMDTNSSWDTRPAEATEPDSDNNYGHRKGVSSCQMLENQKNTFMDGNMDTNSSWDTRPEGGFSFGSQPHTNDSINREPYEDILERKNAVAAEIIENMTIAIPALDDNSLNFALDDDTVGSRLDESANAHSGDDAVSPEGTKQDYHNNHGNGIIFCSSQMGDKIGNSPLLDTRSRDSSSITRWPLANDTVDSGLHEDTLEGQKPDAADNASVVGHFEVDKTKNNENSRDEDNHPRSSKIEGEQNAQECKNIHFTVDRRLHEDALESQKTIFGSPESHAKDMDLMLSTSEMDKTKNENVSCKFQNEEETSPPKTKQEQIEMDEAKNVIISCESQDQKSPRAKQDQNAQESENINNTVDRRLQNPFVGGSESHVKDKALMLGTSGMDKNKNNNISCKSQGKRRSRSSKTKKYQNETNASKDGNISCRSQDKKGPRASKTRQYLNETDEPKGENLSCGSQDKKGHRASKTGQEQNRLNVGHDITEKKYIAISSHKSERSLTHFGDTVVDRLDNSANEGNRDNNCPEDTELDKKKNSGHEIGIGSNQNVINPNSMGDEMDTSCSLGSRSKETSSFRNTSNASTTEDNELHEDTLVGQKPVKGSESLVADKTVNDLELVHNISDKVPEDRDVKIRKTNPDIFLGNEVDSSASETQEMVNPPSASNQLDSNCSSTSGTLLEAGEYRKTTRESKSLGRGSKSNTPKDKTSGVLQPQRGGKVFKEHNSEPETPKACTFEKEANALKANRLKGKMSIRKTSQSKESTSPVISAAVVKWCLATLCLFAYSISKVQGAPALVQLAKWHQWWFCTDGDHLNNQTLVIKNLDRITEEGCSFEAPDVPYYYNCSRIKAMVFLINTTCLEILTTDHQTQKWIVEHGAGYNGESLKTTRGELLSNEEVMDKVGRYTHGDDTQAGRHNRSTTNPGQANKPPDIVTWLPILLCTLAAIVAVALLAYYFCKRRTNTDQPSTANVIELQHNGRDGGETSTSLLSNGISEH